MKKRLEEWTNQQRGILALCLLPVALPVALVFVLALWGWVGLAAHFAASAWGF